MSDVVHGETRGAVAVITLDRPPVNALGQELRAALVARMEEAAADPEVKVLVLAGRGRCFSGGADIREFGAPPKDPHLRAVIDAAENCPKPVVAAIHGVAVGGGLELALGCHYRVGDASARLGQPEVKLGIPPGAGGTQRLPRVIGIAAALDMILSGEPIPAVEAKELGLLDAVIEGDLTEGAVAFAEKVVAEGRPLTRTRDRTIPTEHTEGLFEAARKRIARRSRGMIAPARCIESVENALTLSFDEGMEKERAFFVECLGSEQSKGQRHAFFAERQATKIPGVPADTPVQAIESAAVIGCGTMGGGIAMNFANAGIAVRVLETDPEALDKGLAVIRKNYEGSVSRGRITQEDMDTRMFLIGGTTDYAHLKDADIVIEAVFEEMDLKKQVFARLDTVCKPEAILATNTSTLDVDEIAAATARPEKVIGTHFFSPANVMKLMENVRGRKTSAETIATVMRLSKTIGKVGALVGVCDGFVGNRMLHAYTRQANFLLEEGALPQQIDKVIYDFGFPMGPFAMGDLAGLDVGWRIRQRRAKTRDPDERYSPIGDRICERGRFGQKTGAGWYRYQAGSRTPVPDPEIEKLILEVAAELGVTRRDIGEREILERCLYPLINEGAKILEEGIAIRSSDIDVIWIYGYGFPVYRGGPMFYADRVGVKSIHEVMQRLHQEHGDMLEPAALLADLAKTGKGFGDL
ncbi:MAG: enoyl-CoA hydratase/isomerase family protein [Proteobacteria bacterium]|nr:enoyl-CoA hydratase/isomerase family protein [Pseudomonadota bacterium]